MITVRSSNSISSVLLSKGHAACIDGTYSNNIRECKDKVLFSASAAAWYGILLQVGHAKSDCYSRMTGSIINELTMMCSR